MRPEVPQIILGIVLLVAGILVVKALDNDLGWILFVLGAAVGIRGGILVSQSGMAEIGN